MSRDSIYLFEQTDFSLRFVRCAGGEQPLRIEELREVTVEEAAALVGTLPQNSAIVCASRPKERALHLASVDEAKRHPGMAGIRKFAELSSPNHAVKSIAAVKALDGSAPTDTPWLLSSSTDIDSAGILGLRSLKSKVLEISATLATAGAFAGSVKGTILLIEVGELGSHAMLVGPEGVLAAGAVPLDLVRIGEAVQAELSLKFRGAAVKLFFNADYDFTEAGPKIASRLAGAIKSDLGRFLVDRPAPTELFVTGLPATQQWFGPQLATALGLSTHSPDLKKWTAAAGFSFATPELAATATPNWFPLLNLVKGYAAAKPPSTASWQASWEQVETSVAATPVANVASAVQGKTLPNALAGQPAPVLPSKPPSPATPPAKTAPVTPPASPVPLPTAKAATAAPVSPKPSTAVTDVKTAKSLIAAAAAKAPPASAKPASAVGTASNKPASSAASPNQKLPETPFARSSTPPPFSTRNFATPSKKRLPRLLALLGIAACIVGAAVFYLSSQSRATAQLALEKEQAEERVKAEAEKARLAEEKAQAELDARKMIEAEYAQKLLESETARQQAESEALAQTAARLANARGSLVIITNPAGARVSVGNLPPKESPATFTDIRIGTYPISINLPNHEEVKLDLDVAENATTESGVISLVPSIGSLRINTEPSGVAYELRPANALLIDPASRRSGITPAALDDLAPGDYSVTLTREGWGPHTQVVSITRGATTHLRWAWPNGIVKISSTPSGATVMRGGAVLGVTPLTLVDQPPGETNYELILDRYDPLQIVAQVAGGEIREIAAEFKPEDRVYMVNEVDRKPDAIGEKQPELPYYLTLEGGRVEIELTVNRDGSTRNLNVLQASNTDIGKYCVEAVAKWRFKPGIKNGEPVNVTIKLPFVFKASRS